jgi:hypothetical protein
VKSFKTFVTELRSNWKNVRDDGSLVQHRQQLPIPGANLSKDGGIMKIKPDYIKDDNNEVQAFVSLNNPGITSGEKMITKVEANKLMKKFNITTGSGNLGNTGIHICAHPTKPGFYILRK